MKFQVNKFKSACDIDIPAVRGIYVPGQPYEFVGTIYKYFEKNTKKIIYVGQTTKDLHKRDSCHLSAFDTPFGRYYSNSTKADIKMEPIETRTFNRVINNDEEWAAFKLEVTTWLDERERFHVAVKQTRIVDGNGGYNEDEGGQADPTMNMRETHMHKGHETVTQKHIPLLVKLMNTAVIERAHVTLGEKIDELEKKWPGIKSLAGWLKNVRGGDMVPCKEVMDFLIACGFKWNERGDNTHSIEMHKRMKMYLDNGYISKAHVKLSGLVLPPLEPGGPVRPVAGSQQVGRWLNDIRKFLSGRKGTNPGTEIQKWLDDNGFVVDVLAANHWDKYYELLRMMKEIPALNGSANIPCDGVLDGNGGRIVGTRKIGKWLYEIREKGKKIPDDMRALLIALPGYRWGPNSNVMTDPEAPAPEAQSPVCA